MIRIPVGIVGYRGYSGVELERLLTHHSHTTPYRLAHRADAGDRPEPIGVPGSILLEFFVPEL